MEGVPGKDSSTKTMQ